MAGLTNTIEESVGKFLFGIAAYVPPTTFYVALFTTAPADDGTGGVECTGGSYARVAVPAGAADWEWDAAGFITNLNQILFPTPTVAWGTAVRAALMTASTGGTMWAVTDAINYVTAVSIQPYFDPGDLTFTLD